MTVTLYGIRNCDTVKKARRWLDSRGVAHRFHDYKAEGIDRGRIERWIAAVGWATLLNRSGTTFRKLPETDRQDLGPAKAIELMLPQPSMIINDATLRWADPQNPGRQAIDRYLRTSMNAQDVGLIEPEDVAAVIPFLCSPDAHRITGEAIDVAAGANVR